MKTPCKNCELRTVGCHGTCVSYIMYKARMDRDNIKNAICNVMYALMLVITSSVLDID